MGAVRFGNNQVSGTGIRYNMNATAFTFGWNNHIDLEQTPGKSIVSGLDVRLPEGRYLGHAVPLITLQGIIDTSLAPGTAIYSGATSDGSVNVQISTGALGSLALVGSGYLYYPMVMQFLGKLGEHDSTTHSVGGSISSMISSVSLIPDLNSNKAGSEYLIPYSMQLALVSGPV